MKRFLTLCTSDDIRRLWLLLGVVIATGVLEVAGIASILPFLQLASDPEVALAHPLINRAYQALAFESHRAMLYAVGWAVIVFLGVSNLLTALASWQRQRVAWAIAHHVSVNLAHCYSDLPYRFFLQHDSGDIIKSVIDDVNSLVDGVVIAGCQFVSQLIISGMILMLLITVNAVVALSAIVVFFGIYAGIFLLRKAWFTDMGWQRLAANSDRYIAFVDLISGIKTIKSTGAAAFFIDRFARPSLTFSQLQPRIHFSSVVPRYIVETVAFGAVVAIILILTRRDTGFVEVLPTLTLFALAGYRLMPAANTAYMSISKLLSSYPAIENIYRDVHSGEALAADVHTRQSQPLDFDRAITLDDITFSYGNDEVPVLNSISLQIPKGRKVAFVGPSGSGKTTLVDVLVGLLNADRGSIRIDDTVIDETRIDALQRIIGYVPQEVFLYNDSIASNVAFGEIQVDQERVREACRLAHIDDFIEKELEQGYATQVGERGLRLSGGQRQRIGLARALYRAPQILVLDEATSALDNVTEGRVVDNILGRLPQVTIIMIAHRLSTVRHCDWLCLFDRGQLAAQGRYDDLLTDSQLFRELVSVD